jgi:hypothetical protein
LKYAPTYPTCVFFPRPLEIPPVALFKSLSQAIILLGVCYNKADGDDLSLYNLGVAPVFLLLEEDDAVFLGNVTALIRGDGETAILMRDNTVRATGFTPLTLKRRGERFWENCRYCEKSKQKGATLEYARRI